MLRDGPVPSVGVIAFLLCGKASLPVGFSGAETSAMTDNDQAGLGHVVDAYRDALRRYVRGDSEATLGFFSDRDDVTLANPMGPAVRGPAAVAEAARRAGANFGPDGPLHFDEVSSSFDEVSRVFTPELAYVVQVERHEGRVSGRDEPVVNALRTTLVFRREDGAWRMVHRHADPITTERPVETVLQ
jgi:ketosteroid isomerase-like protein